VLLAPTKTVPKESVEKKMNLEVSKFVRVAGSPSEDTGQKFGGYPAPSATPMEPGFELILAISALMVGFIMRRRL